MRDMRILYTAFDAYPGRKGAQAHIRANLRAVAERGGRATLLCLGRGGSFRDPDSGAVAHTFSGNERNMLRRSEAFGRFLSRMADGMLNDPPAVIHFRDIWSGFPLLSHPLARRCRMVFEVNGLPSIELRNHYPGVADNGPLLARLRRMEDECLAKADRVITVSNHTARYLTERGCDASRIAVIPNAAVPGPLRRHMPEEMAAFERAANHGKVILYTGTLAPWQGLYTLLDAVALLKHRNDFHLVVLASTTKGMKRIRKQVSELGICERVSIMEGIDNRLLPTLYARSYLSVAPLARGARNEIQGCCPLKIVESMANALPVVAADLAVTRELITAGEDGLLVPPESGRALACALDRLLNDGYLRDRLALGACRKAGREFGMKLYAERLAAVYGDMNGGHYG